MPKLYGPAETQTLVGVSGSIRTGSTNVTAFANDVFFAAAKTSIDTSKTVSYLRVYLTDKTGSWSGILDLYYTDDTHVTLSGSNGQTPDLSTYGITVASMQQRTIDYIDLTPITTTTNVSKKIKKLYGSVLAPETYSITPDGTVVTAIDGELLCATAKGQYPNTYKNAATFEFSYTSGTYRAVGEDTNGTSVFYRSGSATALAGAGITFNSNLSSGASVTIPATYIPNSQVSKLIKKLYGSVNGQTKLIHQV